MQKWLRQKIHISWHIAAGCLGFVGGCILAVGPLAHVGWLYDLAALISGPVLLFRSSHGRYMLAAIFIVGLVVGGWRGSVERSSWQHWKPYEGHRVTLSGKVGEDATLGKHGDQRLLLSDITVAETYEKLRGKLWVSSASKQDIRRGDTVMVTGVVGSGFGTIPVSIYRATIVQIERSHPGDIARQLRDWFAAKIRHYVPEPQASLGLGYLTGQRSSLPASLDEQLQAVGLTHAVVASGYNLTILVAFARRLLIKRSKFLATFLAVLLIGGFLLVTGWSPSMSRAAVVTGLSLAAWYYGRNIHPFVLLPVAAAITAAFQPAFVWGDLGWCLSFGAFYGVIIMGPLLERYFWGAAEPPKVAQLLIETIAAELITLPIILYSFGRLASYSLLANVLVVPLIPLAMACTFISGVIAIVAPWLAGWAAQPTTWLLYYTTWVIGKIAEWPGAEQTVPFGLPALVGSYAMVSLLSIYVWKKTAPQFKKITAKKD